MTERLRTHLSELLAKKVQAHGLVVWDDPERQYSEMAETLCPPDTALLRFDGSYYSLRREVEASLSGDAPPRLVIYVPAEPPGEDPLEEARAAGHRFRVRLPTLVGQALQGELTPQRIEEIGRRARTLPEAEAAVAGGESADVRLINVLESTDTTQMILAVMCAEKDERIAADDAWEAVAAMLASAIGGSYSGGRDVLRQAAMRQLVLTELAARLGGVSGALEPAISPTTSEQKKRAVTVLEAWRRDERRREAYARAATTSDQDLELGSTLGWEEALADAGTVPAIESLAFAEALRLLQAGEPAAARSLAKTRLEESIWVRSPFQEPLHGAQLWGPRWRVVDAIAELRLSIGGAPPSSGSALDQLRWYVDSGAAVDRAHRRMERALSELHTEGELEDLIGDARTGYESWLDRVLTGFTDAIDAQGFDLSAMKRQVEVHPRFVAASDTPTAYVWVDALRYELGEEFADALRVVNAGVSVEPAVASVPTITPVGMASLCPGADVALEIDLEGRKLGVSVDGRRIRGVPERLELLRAAHGEIVDLSLSDVVARGEKELARKIKGAALVVVRSQEMDAVGETGMLAITWAGLHEVKDQLVRAVARLAQAGIRRFVIASDHGFVVLSRGLRTDRVVAAPAGGTGDLGRRSWVGRGAATTPSTLRVSLAEAGIKSDLDLISPRTLAVFAGPSTRQFFHGGLSPQELVVPVIVVETQQAGVSQGRRLDVEIVGNRIVTGAFSVSIAFDPDLFTSELAVRAIARLPDGREVARPVSGEGLDEATGVISLVGGKPTVVTFQLIANLGRGEEVEVQVLDARTDRMLGVAKASAAAPIVVEDTLG